VLLLLLWLPAHAAAATPCCPLLLLLLWLCVPAAGGAVGRHGPRLPAKLHAHCPLLLLLQGLLAGAAAERPCVPLLLLCAALGQGALQTHGLLLVLLLPERCLSSRGSRG
jgi:hypothetical protein